MCKICLTHPEGEEWCPICFFKATTIDTSEDRHETARCHNDHWWVYGIGICRYCVNNQVANILSFRKRKSLKSGKLIDLFGDPPLMKNNEVKEVKLKSGLTINQFDAEFGIFDVDVKKKKK